MSRVRFPMVSLEFFLTQSFQPHNGPGVDSASDRNEYQEYFLGDKGGRCVRLTLRLSSADYLESGSLNLLDPSGPVQACNGIALPFFTVLNCDALTKLLYNDGYRGRSFHYPTLKIPKDKITKTYLPSNIIQV